MTHNKENLMAFWVAATRNADKTTCMSSNYGNNNYGNNNLKGVLYQIIHHQHSQVRIYWGFVLPFVAILFFFNVFLLAFHTLIKVSARLVFSETATMTDSYLHTLETKKTFSQEVPWRFPKGHGRYPQNNPTLVLVLMTHMFFWYIHARQTNNPMWDKPRSDTNTTGFGPKTWYCRVKLKPNRQSRTSSTLSPGHSGPSRLAWRRLDPWGFPGFRRLWSQNTQHYTVRFQVPSR